MHVKDGIFVDHQGFADTREKIVELVNVYKSDPHVLFGDPHRELTRAEIAEKREDRVNRVLNDLAVLMTKLFWPECLRHLIAGKKSPYLKNPYNGKMVDAMLCKFSSCRSRVFLLDMSEWCFFFVLVNLYGFLILATKVVKWLRSPSKYFSACGENFMAGHPRTGFFNPLAAARGGILRSFTRMLIDFTKGKSFFLSEFVSRLCSK